MSCATRVSASVRSRSPRFARFPLDALRAALGQAQRVVVLEKALAVGIGGIVTANVRMALAGIALHGYTVIAGLGGRPITKASLRRLFDEAVHDRLEPLTFLDMDWDVVNRELARMGASRTSGPHAENILLDVVRSRQARCEESTKMTAPAIRFYQTGSLAVGNRLLDPDQRSVQAAEQRTNSITCGHRACQGCGEALGARYALDAAMRATSGQMIAANATGCLEVFSTPYPETSWRIPWIHSLFGNAPAVSTGIAAALRAKGRTDVRVVGQGGDGGTVDIGFACLSGMFERNDDVLYICYDNEAYMNTGVQRSGATPPAARTATTQAVGRSRGTCSVRARARR